MRKLRYLKTVSGGTESLGTHFIGTSANPMSRLYNEKGMAFYFTCPSSNASSSFEPVLFHTVMINAGQVGGRVRVTMESNVKLGDWANAFKALIDWKTSGGVTGMGSAICAEMVMPASGDITQGIYAGLEVEIVCPTDWTGVRPISFIYAATSGNTRANFDTIGYLFHLTGISEGNHKMFQTNSTNTMTHALKIRIGTSDYFIPLHQTSVSD